MAYVTYRGALITENWPTAARMKGATRPSDERWTATFDDLSQLHANTLPEMRQRINERLQEAGQ
jgi:hypothetical protein